MLDNSNVFDPEVYGEPVYSETLFDTDVYGELPFEPSGITVYAQAQATIITSFAQKYGQVQASILVFGVNSFAQANALIVKTTQVYAQAQALIIGPLEVYAQAQALIIGPLEVYAQAQALIIGPLEVYAQAQTSILTKYLVQAQAQTQIKQIYWGFGQAKFSIKAKSNVFAQSQANIRTIYKAYGQTNSDILTTYKIFGQANSGILTTYKIFGQAQAFIDRSVYAQAQAHIKAFYWGYAQAQSSILQAYRVSAQASSTVITTLPVGQAQAWIKQIYTASAQANAYTIYVYQGYAQAQAHIKAFYWGYAQAQSSILQAYRVSAQASSTVITTLPVGQAQAWIYTIYVPKWAQAAANINSPIKVKFANSQAFISKSVVISQAQAFIILRKPQAQAQAQIKRFKILVNAQARAFIINKKKQGQAQARIRRANRGYAQSGAHINKLRGQGQAQAKILSFKTQQKAQAQAYMKHLEGTGHVRAKIIQIHPPPNAPIGGNLEFPGILSPIGGDSNQLSPDFAVRAGTRVTVTLTQALNDGGNIGVLSTDGGGENMSQNSPAINTPYTFTFTSTVLGYRLARIYSWLSSTYRPGLTGIGTYVISGGDSYGQAGARIKIKNTPQVGQAQSQIVHTVEIYGQAQSRILAEVSMPGQAMAHIIGNTGYSQAQAKIYAYDFNQYAQAQALITDFFLYLKDTFTRVEALGTGVGTPDVGPDWVAYGTFPPALEPVSIDGTQLKFNNNIPSDDPESTYGWMWIVSPIATVNAVFTLDLYLENNFPYFEMDLRQVIGSYSGIWYDAYEGTWRAYSRKGGSGPNASPVVYALDANTWYTLKLSAIGDFIIFSIWKRDSESEPVTPLVTLYHDVTGFPVGGAGIYLDNNSVLSPTFSYIDNVNVSGPLYTWSFGQANALLIVPTPYVFAQARTFIYGEFRSLGQARAYVYKINISTGLAVARILMTEIGEYYDSGWHYIFNTSNEYQAQVMQDFPTAYYTLNEPLLPAWGGVYSASNMLYKDVVWDNVGLYDLRREYGNLSYGPYGGTTVGQYSGVMNLTSPDNLTSYFSTPTGIPGAVGDNGILSREENNIGFNYLYRYGQSAPLSLNYSQTIEFWYRLLATPSAGTFHSIVLVGNLNETDAGAISIGYLDGSIVTRFGQGGYSSSGPTYAGIVVGELYHVVLVIKHYTTAIKDLYINGELVDSVVVVGLNIQSTVFIGAAPTTSLHILDELAFYDYLFDDPQRIKAHYLAGINFYGGFAQAGAIIIGQINYGQAQADIFTPWSRGNARARIRQVPHKVAQAQAYIKGDKYAQAQALITRAKSGLGQAQAILKKYPTVSAQARARITTTVPVGQAQAFINNSIAREESQSTTDTPFYNVSYNGYTLPGYAQQETFDSIMAINAHYAPYREIGFTEYMGLENRHASLIMLVKGQNYLDCKNQIELAATLLRSNREGFAPMHIQHYDRHYEVLTTSIKTEGTVANITTAEYEVEFECKPWLVSDFETSFTGNTSVTTTGRTIDNGGWTPATIILSGNNVTVSGYTATGDFTGFISISGGVSNLMIDTETYEVTSNGENRSEVMLTDHTMYVGPGETTFDITGATDFTITYHDRFYL